MTSSDEQDEIFSSQEEDMKKTKKKRSKILYQIAPSNDQLTTVKTQKKNHQHKEQCNSSEKYVQKHQYEGTKITFDPALHLTTQDTLIKTDQIKVERKDQRKQHYMKKRKKYKDYTRDNNDLMLENLSREYYKTKSPYLLINR